ncbi:MAG: transporter substrate-binding domain-containing protein [Deltaproteobacteria bacterium]|nr:transporter substrate-binding domain-containing protein [Deltaproteobacteria bacterium]
MSAVCQAELRILGEESPPGEYLDENGNPAGVTIDLVKDLLRRQGITATISILPWKRAYHMGLHEKKVVLLETTRTEEREDLFKWVGPILVLNRVIYSMADYDGMLKKTEDIKHVKKICVLRGSSNETYLKALGLTNINPVGKPSQCLKMLQSRRVQLFYTSEIGMDGLLTEQNMAPDSVKAIFNLKKEYLYLAFSKDISELQIMNWQATLEDSKRDGTLANIYQGVYSEETIKEVCLPGDPLARGDGSPKLDNWLNDASDDQ